MKLEKLFSAAWAFLLSFAASLSVTMCVVTAFHLGIDTGLLLRTCLYSALVCTLCYTLPLSLVPVGAGAAIVGYLWKNGTLLLALEAFLNRLSRQYDRAYGWGIIRWGYRLADEMEPDIVIILCILGAAIAMLTAWAVCRRQTILPALFLSLFTFATCFVVNDTVPDIPWLYLLILCFLVLIMTGAVRLQDEKQGNRLCLLLTPAAAVALLILFAAIPQKGYNGQETAKKLADTVLNSDSMQLLLGHMDDNSAVSGTTDTNAVDLSSVGYRVETHAQVLQVTAPYTGDLYLRGRTLDLYDGKTWHQSDNNYESLYWPDAQLEDTGILTVSTRFAHRMLYMPYYVNTGDLGDISKGIRNETSLTEYSFSCRRPAVAITGTQDFTPMREYIPTDPEVIRWAQYQADKLRTTAHNTLQIASTIGSYVRSSATYSTRTARMPSGEKDFAKWFLEESDTGYCVHFATAATVLLQAAGIPARYVTGYYTQVKQGETVTVYSDQAHAWTEYWLPGFGWTVLEATPPDFSEDPEATTEATADGTGAAAPTATAPESITIAPTDAPAPKPQANRDWILWVLLTITAASALVTAAEGQRSLRRFLRKRKLAAATPNEKALLYWQDTVLYARLLNEAPDKTLFDMAQKAKFSQYTLTEEQLQRFEVYARDALSRLHRHHLLRRLYYRIILAI